MNKLLKTQNPNALNFFKMRRPASPPPHFEYISIPLRYNLQESISKWIYDNLNGRYYVGSTINTNSSNHLEKQLKVGFENPKELSYFTLACPHLKY